MELVGLAEIAELLGISKQAVTNWRARKASFPGPVATLKSGPVWSAETIRSWAAGEGISFAEAAPGEMAKRPLRNAIVAAIMNMKGGVGKSTLTANVGWYAAYYHNKRVLLVDLDPQFNLSQYILGVRGYEKLLDDGSPLIDQLFRSEGAVEVDEIVAKVQNWNDGSCLHILPASLQLAFSVRNSPQKAHVLRDNLADLKASYDLVLIDCAPTESMLSTAAYLASDYIFVPVRPEFLSTIGLPLLLKSMEEFQREHKNEALPTFGGIIFNDIGEKSEHARSKAYVSEIAQEHDLSIFTNSISHSDSYPTGSRAGKPIFVTEYARGWKKDEFNRVAAEFMERLGL